MRAIGLNGIHGLSGWTAAAPKPARLITEDEAAAVEANDELDESDDDDGSFHSAVFGDDDDDDAGSCGEDDDDGGSCIEAMVNTGCRDAVDEGEAERAFRWPAESGGATSVLSRSRGLQPFMQELDLNARARFDPGNPTMAAAATRLQACAVTRAFSIRNEYSLSPALFALSLESQCACRNYLAKLMWHRALIAASARAEPEARAFRRGACFPLALTSESLGGATLLGTGFKCAACSQTWGGANH